MKDQTRVLDTLVRGRELYAAAPSHAPLDRLPAPGTLCAVMALEDAGARRAIHYIPVADALLDAMGDTAVSIAHWNADHTTEEVLAAFDRAIATERERCRTQNDLDGIPVREPVRTLSEPVPA
jgi:hypothetical protein